LDGQDLSDCRQEKLQADRASFMRALGTCRFIADTTHPQIAYICGVLGRHVRQPAVRHMGSLKRVMRYLRGVSSCGLTCHPFPTTPRTIAACDTDYAQCVDTRRSTTGIVNVLVLEQVPSAAQRADFLTNPLKRVLFLRACASHNLTT
jgi:hypothetical protein